MVSETPALRWAVADPQAMAVISACRAIFRLPRHVQGRSRPGSSRRDAFTRDTLSTMSPSPEKNVDNAFRRAWNNRHSGSYRTARKSKPGKTNTVSIQVRKWCGNRCERCT